LERLLNGMSIYKKIDDPKIRKKKQHMTSTKREVWFRINKQTDISVMVDEYDNVMGAIRQLAKDTNLPILHFGKMMLNEKEVSAREKLNTLDDDATIHVEMMDRRMSNAPAANKTGKMPQTDLEQIIEECKRANIIIRLVKDDTNDPIHDARCNHVGKPFAQEREDFLDFNSQQFYDPEKKSYSERRPLSLALTWGQYDILDIGRAILNVQNCNFTSVVLYSPTLYPGAVPVFSAPVLSFQL